jgi:hypothetical protein
MRRLLQIAFAGWLGVSMSLAQAWAFPGNGGAYTPVSGSAPDTSGYTKDTGRSDALTSYLKQHRLPLVGAQVLNDPSSGKRVIVLYGFVATDFGKSDATAKARAFLNDPAAVVENRVMVDPEIASQPAGSHHHEYAGGAASSQPPDPSSADPDSANADDGGAGSAGGPDSYIEHQSQQAQIQQYENQQNPMSGGGAPSGGMGGTLGGMSGGGMVPLVALLGLLSATNGGSSLSFGSSGPFGMRNSFGGAGPYQPNPYGGGSSSNGYPPGAFPPGPYGSPYGNPPGSFSPYP